MSKSFWVDFARTHLLFWAGISFLGMIFTSVVFTFLFSAVSLFNVAGILLYASQLGSLLLCVALATVWGALLAGSVYGLFQIARGLRRKSMMEIAVHASAIFLVFGATWTSMS